MRLCAQRNSWPKRTEWSEDLIHTPTYTHPPPNSRTVTWPFLNLYIDGINVVVLLYRMRHVTFVYILIFKAKIKRCSVDLTTILCCVDLISAMTTQMETNWPLRISWCYDGGTVSIQALSSGALWRTTSSLVRNSEAASQLTVPSHHDMTYISVIFPPIYVIAICNIRSEIPTCRYLSMVSGFSLGVTMGGRL